MLPILDKGLAIDHDPADVAGGGRIHHLVGAAADGTHGVGGDDDEVRQGALGDPAAVPAEAPVSRGARGSD